MHSWTGQGPISTHRHSPIFPQGCIRRWQRYSSCVFCSRGAQGPLAPHSLWRAGPQLWGCPGADLSTTGM